MKKICSVVLYLLILNTNLFACQPIESWLPKSNFELVKEAYSIVLVKIDSQTSKIDKEYRMPIIKTDVIEVFKGSVKDKNIFLVGDLSYEGASAEDDFSDVRRGAKLGMCSAFDYKVDGLFVLFLNKRGKHMVGMAGRTNEEVLSINSPWVKSVLEYIKIDKINNYKKEKEALKKLLNISHGIKGLNADIERHFKMITQYKSTEDLEQRYKNTLDKDEKRRVLWALLNKNFLDDTVLFEELLSSDEWLNYVTPITYYLLEKNEKNRVKMLVDGYYKISNNDEISNDDSWNILQCIGKLASKKDEQIILKLLKSNPKKYIGSFSPWLLKYPSSDLLKLVENTDFSFGDYRLWLLVKLGNKSNVTWAKENMFKDFEDRGKAYTIIAMSPLDEADKLAKEIIESSSTVEDIINLAQGYEESTNKNKEIRLREILKKYGDNKDIT